VDPARILTRPLRGLVAQDSVVCASCDSGLTALVGLAPAALVGAAAFAAASVQPFAKGAAERPRPSGASVASDSYEGR
jgi:hypothetical protein